MRRWEAWAGTTLVKAGKKRDGKTRWILLSKVYVAHSASDAAALSKEHPRLKFVAKGRNKR
jgi:hypothetical protein